jgi:hypothetical protein
VLVKVPDPGDFSSRLRGPAIASRIGVWLGACFLLAFVTGVYSHLAQDQPGWFPNPTRPVWLYRVTQGLHVASGTAAVPLLLVKLWSVYPKLFERVPVRDLARTARHVAERASIAVLVAGSLFQLATGLANSTGWYPWEFSFRATHYAVGWITIGALIVHVAVKLPLIVASLRTPLDSRPRSTARDGVRPTPRDGVRPTPRNGVRPTPRELREGGGLDGGADHRLPAIPGEVATTMPSVGGSARPEESTADGVPAGLTRRGLLVATGVASGAALVTTVGAAVPALRRISVFGVTSGDGPGGVPINTTAQEAAVVAAARDPAFRFVVLNGDRRVVLSVDELRGLPQADAELPIACVEGWSASGTWAGVRISELLALVDAPPESTVAVTSLQESGPFRRTELPADFSADPLSLMALRLDGQPLSTDHGYPCRLIAPNRPGVLQTKWVRQLEVIA